MKKGIFYIFFFICIGCFAQMEVGGIVLKSKEKVMVEKKEWAWVKRVTGEKFPVVSVIMNSGKMVYEIRHDKKHADGAIGLAKPTSANWYQSGMVSIYINGQRFNFLPEEKEKIEMVEGEAGKAMFSWENETAKLFINFYLFLLDDKIFMEVKVEPKKEIKDLEIKFINYTGGFNRNRKHRVYTENRILSKKGWNNINLDNERWLLLTDDNMNYGKDEKAQGPSAIAYLPENFNGAKIFLGGYSCGINFKCKSGPGRFIFTLWEFPAKTNEEVAGKMKNYAEDAMEKMKKIMEGKIK